MQNIAVFFGGRSCEHDISVITGVSACKNVGKLYNVIPVYIDSDGKWYSGKALLDMKTYVKSIQKSKAYEVSLLPSSDVLYRLRGRFLQKIGKIHCGLLCTHGLNGEDGTLQGLLQLSQIPYTSSGVLGSACGMDKAMTKRILLGAGIPQLPFVTGRKKDFLVGKEEFVKKILTELELPVIVKPANLGSSIGISVAKSKEELIEACETAYQYDKKAVFEPALKDFIEINCSAIRCGGQVLTSNLEQPLSWQDFLTFDEKYKGSGKMQNGSKKFPADISCTLADKIKDITAKVYSLLELSGVIRADFLIKDGEVYLNEVNTIPGSLSYYLWQYEGISFQKLIDIMIVEAEENFKESSVLHYAYRSDLLTGVSIGGGKSACKNP